MSAAARAAANTPFFATLLRGVEDSHASRYEVKERSKNPAMAAVAGAAAAQPAAGGMAQPAALRQQTMSGQRLAAGGAGGSENRGAVAPPVSANSKGAAGTPVRTVW